MVEELLVDQRSLVPARPWLKPWYQRVVTDDSVLLTHGESIVVVKGRAATRLLPALLELLDGSLTVEEVVAALGEPIRPATLRARPARGARPPPRRRPRPAPAPPARARPDGG